MKIDITEEQVTSSKWDSFGRKLGSFQVSNGIPFNLPLLKITKYNEVADYQSANITKEVVTIQKAGST